MTTRQTKPVAMCCVTIDYQEFLMPADKGMKVVELLQSAFKCERRYDERSDRKYYIGEQPQVEFALVRSNQVAEAAVPAPVRRLGLER